MAVKYTAGPSQPWNGPVSDWTWHELKWDDTVKVLDQAAVLIGTKQ